MRARADSGVEYYNPGRGESGVVSKPESKGAHFQEGRKSTRRTGKIKYVHKNFVGIDSSVKMM